MVNKATESSLRTTFGMFLVLLCAVPVQAENTNTTIQQGRVNVNRTVQYGDSNENATYQSGKVNINHTIQIGSNNRNETGQFGSTNHNKTAQERGFDRSRADHGTFRRGTRKRRDHQKESG